MFKRLQLYFKEMYPLLPRMLLGFLLFFEIYFLVILTNSRPLPEIRIGFAEIVGSVTIFSFLLFLRVADDFKDYKGDLLLFPDRPLPSGRVQKKDLIVLLGVLLPLVAIGNIVFLNNIFFFLLLAAYGVLMSVWFFQKHKIQKSLPLALVTHNPVQIVINLYIISFACFKYGIPLVSFNNLVIALTLYFPGLIWEISRKIRAPEEETDYTTYSKLFGYRKATYFILAVMLIDFFSTSYLLYQLYPWAVFTVLASYLWLVWQCMLFLRNPLGFKLVSRIELYEYLAEGTVVVLIAAYLFGWWR